MKPTLEQLDLIKLCKSALSKLEKNFNYDEIQDMIDSFSCKQYAKIQLDYYLFSIFDIIRNYEDLPEECEKSSS